MRNTVMTIRQVVYKCLAREPYFGPSVTAESLLERAGVVQAHRLGRNRVVVQAKDGRTLTVTVEEQR